MAKSILAVDHHRFILNQVMRSRALVSLAMRPAALQPYGGVLQLIALLCNSMAQLHTRCFGPGGGSLFQFKGSEVQYAVVTAIMGMRAVHNSNNTAVISASSTDYSEHVSGQSRKQTGG